MSTTFDFIPMKNILCKGSHKKVSFFSGQFTKEEGVRSCPLMKRTFFLDIFFFYIVAVVLTTKPGGGGLRP